MNLDANLPVVALRLSKKMVEQGQIGLSEKGGDRHVQEFGVGITGDLRGHAIGILDAILLITDENPVVSKLGNGLIEFRSHM